MLSCVDIIFFPCSLLGGHMYFKGHMTSLECVPMPFLPTAVHNMSMDMTMKKFKLKPYPQIHQEIRLPNLTNNT